MKILAFETSCDDTGVAVVENGTKVLANVCASQTEHSKFGGVVPELASRLHAEHLFPVLEECLKQANLTIDDIDALAVTQGPGLSPALLNGTTAASFLGLMFKKPVIAVHHILGHMASVFLERDLSFVKFPALVLTVSGGHTQMHLWRDFTDLEMVGTTIDDAAGEAFDKTAKMLGLGYPGGPLVSQRAMNGDSQKYKLPLIYLNKESLDFSFSGLKAAIYRLVEKERKDNGEFFEQFIADVCASFEETVAKTFNRKVERVLVKYPEIKNVAFVGGVSANRSIRASLNELLKKRGLSELIVPKALEFCTDNAAMIGAAAYLQYKKDPVVAQQNFVDSNPRLVI